MSVVIFASFEFLCLFLPSFFLAYFATPFRHRNYVILIFSWGFYAWWRVDFLLLLIGVTVFTYTIARLMDRVQAQSRRARMLMIVGLVGNVGVLAYFKYANFGVATLNQMRGAMGMSMMSWTEILLPIGLSFYVLQSVSYLIDIHRGTVPISRSFINYAAYKAIFSQLIAGPIVRYAEIADELKHRDHSLRQFGVGGRIFAIGFAMKVVIADTLSPLVDAAFTLPQPALLDSWIAAISYTIQIYFDFAGYSLMAIGLARMIGFHFPQNFDNPYVSSSIQEFWQHWHMTLSRFLRDYLYIPFGGNRRGAARTYINLMAVMAIGGLWHGSSWNFIVWGLWQGALLSVHRWWNRSRFFAPCPYVLANGLTMSTVVIGWVVFRAKDLPSAVAVYAGMLGLNGPGISDAFRWQITSDRIWMIPVATAIIYFPLVWTLIKEHVAFDRPLPIAGKPVYLALFTLYPFAVLMMALIFLYSRAAVPFLYFQF